MMHADFHGVVLIRNFPIAGATRRTSSIAPSVSSSATFASLALAQPLRSRTASALCSTRLSLVTRYAGARHPQRRDILSDFEGVIKPGEMVRE